MSTPTTIRPTTRPGRALLLLLAALALALTACTGAPQPLTEEERVDRAAELAARLPSERAVARYEEMLQRISDQLDAELGPFAWRTYREQRWGACGSDFPGPGRIVRLQGRGFDAPLPGADWPAAKRIVTTVATEYGFAGPDLDIDKPAQGDQQTDFHTITGTDPALGASYTLSTNLSTVINVVTGCHPTPATTP